MCRGETVSGRAEAAGSGRWSVQCLVGSETEGVTQLRSYCEFMLRQLGLGPVSGGGRKGLGR